MSKSWFDEEVLVDPSTSFPWIEDSIADLEFELGESCPDLRLQLKTASKIYFESCLYRGCEMIPLIGVQMSIVIRLRDLYQKLSGPPKLQRATERLEYLREEQRIAFKKLETQMQESLLDDFWD